MFGSEDVLFDGVEIAAHPRDTAQICEKLMRQTRKTADGRLTILENPFSFNKNPHIRPKNKNKTGDREANRHAYVVPL